MIFSEYIQKICKTSFLEVKVISNARKSEFCEILPNGIVKIKISAQREKGKANKELILFLSKNLRLSKDKISIISGETRELKKISIDFY
ncbi:MAG: DUF167 domain-containing protein [Candidatus Gracilibacteria bacterium]|nr:DUF167 domain-containing protein [Candidatus Gracilibacteria bacterium]